MKKLEGRSNDGQYSSPGRQSLYLIVLFSLPRSDEREEDTDHLVGAGNPNIDIAPLPQPLPIDINQVHDAQEHLVHPGVLMPADGQAAETHPLADDAPMHPDADYRLAETNGHGPAGEEAVAEGDPISDIGAQDVGGAGNAGAVEEGDAAEQLDVAAEGMEVEGEPVDGAEEEEVMPMS